LKKIINWFLLVGFSLGVVVVIVAIVELYCAYSYYRYRDTLKNDLNAIRLREPFHNQDNNGFRTDSLGFILPYRSLDSSVYRIVLLGGSTTECLAVSEEKRVHRAVEKQLDKTTCLNIGNSGNHSMHTLDIFANKILAYNPDVVVINHNVNDLSMLLNSETYHNNHSNRSLLLTSSEDLYSYVVGYPKNWFVRNFIPHISLVLLPTTFEGESLPVVREFPDGPLRDDLNMDSLKLVFKKSLKGLVEYSKAWGVKPVLLTQGSCFKHYSIGNLERYKGYNLDSLHNVFNQVVREIALESGAALVDAELLMEDNKDYFYDVVHYTDAGSLFISNHISATVKKLLFD